MSAPISLLIATEVLDIHAVAVDIAMTDGGHDVVRLFAEDLPQRLAASFTIDPHTEAGLVIRAPGLERSFGQFDTVWYRRPCPPILPIDVLHPDDLAAASQENSFFNDGIWALLGREAFWINPLGARRESRSKLLQLAEAQKIGFKVPRTLASNDPERIREFIRSNKAGTTVFKAFEGHFWDAGPGVRVVNYTTLIEEASLPSDTLLRAVPGIFQQRVAKASELRVTCFGRHLVAARLLSQVHEYTSLDWRVVDPKHIPIEPYTLPVEVEQACWQLMQRLGIVVGCFDFIVTPDGEYVFLEVNEMGQFLWIEEVNPDFHLLDTFVDFVIARTPDFAPRQKPRSARLSFHEIAGRQEYQHALEFDVENHIGTSVKNANPPLRATEADKETGTAALPASSLSN